jgi:hypothetical protein
MASGQDKKKISAKTVKKNTNLQSASSVDIDQCEYQQHLIHLQAQSEADEEYARQLAKEFATETNYANKEASASAIREEPGETEDMDAILAEIARMESQENLNATGQSYNEKPNINRILEYEDEEEARIYEKVKHEAKLLEWREERARQNAEFEVAEEQDRMQELAKKIVESSKSAQNDVPIAASEAPLLEPIPLTKEDLRRARLAFFTANLQKS